MKLFSSTRAWMAWLLVIIILLSLYFILADHITPTTNDAFVRSYAIRVSPQVSGRITKVYVENNEHVKQGQQLFEIYRTPYLYNLQKAEAELVATKNKISELQASIKQAEGLLIERKADLNTAMKHYKELNTLSKSGFVSESQMLDITKKVADARASYGYAIQALSSAKQELGSSIDGVNVHIKKAEASLALAKLHYKETIVRAPYSGIITNLHTYVGNYANTGDAQMTIVEQSDWWVQANMKENNLAKIRVGQPAYVVLNMYPGKLFKAKVTGVGTGVNLSANFPGNYLPYIEKTHNWVRLAQRFPVQLEFEDFPKDYALRAGASANVTIFTGHSWFWNGLASSWLWVRSLFQFLS